MTSFVLLMALVATHPLVRAAELEAQLATAQGDARLGLLSEAATLPWPASGDALEEMVAASLSRLDAATRRAWAQDHALPVLSGELVVSDEVRRLLLDELKAQGLPERAADVALARARILYRRGRVAEAEAVYREVPRLSDAWPEALREQAWSLFVLGRTADALGASVSLSAPWFAGEDNAEALLLAGAALVGRCRWEEARALIASLADAPPPTLDPTQAAQVALAAQAPPEWDVVLATPLVARVRKLLLDAPEVARRTQLTALATRLVEEGAQDRLALARELRRRALAIRYEALRGERRLREAGLVPARAPAAEAEQLDDDEVVWRFDGTWWLDELGTYRWALGDACGRTP